MFKTREGGGVKGRLNNVKKNCTIGAGWLPLSPRHDMQQQPQPHVMIMAMVMWWYGGDGED